MDSELCLWKKIIILVFNIFLLLHRLTSIYRLKITRRHVLHFVLVYSFVNRTLIQIDLGAKFGAGMSPFVCAHLWAAVHACVRDVQPESHQAQRATHLPVYILVVVLFLFIFFSALNWSNQHCSSPCVYKKPRDIISSNSVCQNFLWCFQAKPSKRFK